MGDSDTAPSLGTKAQNTLLCFFLALFSSPGAPRPMPATTPVTEDSQDTHSGTGERLVTP